MEQEAARLVELSEARASKPEYGRFIMGTLSGDGYPHSILLGGGSNTALVGTEFNGGGVPAQTPSGAKALVHTHPYTLTPSGKGRQAIMPEPSSADRRNAVLRGIPFFSVNQNGIRVALPNGTVFPYTFPLGGGR